ncbi:MAG: hypothetical protein AAF514_06800 [Verrucomicrobiota bacterium]
MAEKKPDPEHGTEAGRSPYEDFQAEQAALLQHQEAMASRLGRPVAFEEAILEWAALKKKKGENPLS